LQIVYYLKTTINMENKVGRCNAEQDSVFWAGWLSFVRFCAVYRFAVEWRAVARVLLLRWYG
jgi:hypothetical protein